MRRHLGLILLASLALAGAAAIASAGGPWYVYEDDEDGSHGPLRWVADTVVWYADPGKLANSVNNADALKMVRDAFTAWTTCTKLEDESRNLVKTCTAKATEAGAIAEDITVSNYESKCMPPGSSKTCIIFDPDGAIVTDAGFDKNSVVGISQALQAGSDGTAITQGIVILNGTWLDRKDGNGNPLMSRDVFKAAIVHELGHLFNLDHAQVNNANCSTCETSGAGEYCGSCPTMYPVLVSEQQSAPHTDDVVAISLVYPAAAFEGRFGTIFGSVYDANGCFLKGVNVVAARTGAGADLGRSDVRAMVSGVLYPGYSGNGRYYLYGLKPNAQYTVVAEPIDAEFSEESGFEPISNPPQGFDAEVITTPGGEEVVIAPAAGQSTEMASLTIDVENPCVAADKCPTDCSGGGGGSTGKSCALAPGAPFGATAALGLLAMLTSIGAVAVRRRRS